MENLRNIDINRTDLFGKLCKYFHVFFTRYKKSSLMYTDICIEIIKITKTYLIRLKDRKIFFTFVKLIDLEYDI